MFPGIQNLQLKDIYMSNLHFQQERQRPGQNAGIYSKAE